MDIVDEQWSEFSHVIDDFGADFRVSDWGAVELIREGRKETVT